MRETTNRPIFVVGSPESNWMGEFALNVGASYQVGVARGDRTILSAMDISRAEFFANFGGSINNLILSHRSDLEKKRKMIRPSSEPKMRWVDGTPEYSLHICALRKLFPEAVFVHVLRDVRDVVRSMLNFHRVAGFELVRNESQAYKYWLRTVKACAQAEQAYGSRVVHRLFYTDLIENPESLVRSLLEFVGEPYCARCLEPLSKRINSSNVPADFVAEDPATDPRVVEEATTLYTELQKTSLPTKPFSAAADEMEAAFNRKVQHIVTVDDQLQNARRTIKTLEKQCRLEKQETGDRALL
ncbi:MAG: hypothetical protein DME55_10550 [Verrucomicrobia bacterium]|nr:MAG: hypothetical protein DME55_10550 [Verrucomicrobiota bacterium]